MIVTIQESVIIKPGLARISLMLYDDLMVFKGEYSFAVDVTADDTKNTLRQKLIRLLGLAINTPKVVYELAGDIFIIKPTELESKKEDTLPEYRKATAE
jgi:hypothetical protein